ncbi:hypothetical protein [Pseudoalteromonas umbrosa]|uniref:hypothetical protein n=1 Tax=Pseudoalteromonas umbrosa TaxID=3048489 RepID=UPI0024C3532D|nr:hypothetical protein [Pseudoalteromonas sp. B95]MDK1290153.1 hypothetical protein [Pseudoalteromonas sp. B95]
MMRLTEEADRISFLSELGYALDTDMTSIPETEIHEFVKRRSGLIRGAKKAALSKKAKRNWRHNRKAFMKGIKKFHSSTSGKRLHRQMGRFLAFRITSSGTKSSKMLRETLLKAVSSMRTHLYIENETYQSIQEQRDLGIMMDYVVPALLEIEQRWWQQSDGELLVEAHSVSLSDDEFEMLMCLTHPNAINSAFFEVGHSENYINVVQSTLQHCTMSENELSFLQAFKERLNNS